MFACLSFPTQTFLFFFVLGLLCVIESCKENSDCRNGYCTSSICICNPGWWGNLCQFCRLRLTADDGFITDGDGMYASLSKCSWLIESQRENSTIILDFEEFATECNWDHLYVYDGKSVKSPLIGAISGLIRDETKSQYSNAPLLKLEAKSGSALLYFYSDKHYVENGFKIKYRVSKDCSAKCSFHGVCNEQNKCSCEPGWGGEDCSMRTCIADCVNGHCDLVTRLCVCQPGFFGASCNITDNHGHWVQYASIAQDLIQGRASHAAGVVGDFIWIYGGFSLNLEPFDNLVRYHIPTDAWEIVNSSDAPARRYGHSMVVHNGSLIVFGGIVNKRTTNELWSFDTKTRTWQLVTSEGVTPLAVAGHSATIVGSKMIVLFGYGSEKGFSNKVQEYHLDDGKWVLFDAPSSIINPTYGHSCVYDPVQQLIYIHGGFISLATVNGPTNATSAYHPHNRKWYTLKSSRAPRFLHSAVIVDNVMLVFGGNSHNGTVLSRSNMPCYSSDFMAYDRSCNEWKRLPKSEIPETAIRYGHTAVVANRTMYVFGGFQGVTLNSMLSYTPGPCALLTNRNSCELQYNLSGCVWAESSASCVGPEKCIESQIKDIAKCPEFNTCSQCTASLHNCLWCDGQCVKENCPKKQQNVVSPDKCSGSDVLKSGCQGKHCVNRCHNISVCEDCLAVQRCMWCESQQQCVATDAYPISFPYGQCLGWINVGECSAVRCSGLKTCDECHTLPGCGWCDDGSGTGLGQCMDGGDDGPSVDTTDAAVRQCPAHRWYFVECPDCQCNGHSKCINKNICNKCEHQTVGPHCERCGSGHYGDAKNGGTCKACECNGHAITCHPETGKCDCIDYWVSGDHCERCKNVNDVIGNATNGGRCYGQVESNFPFQFDVSNKTRISFLYIPEEDDIDVKFVISVKRGYSALLNVTVGSVSMAEETVVSFQEIGRYEKTFSHEVFKFGGREKFTFKVHVFAIEGSVMLEISFIQRKNFIILNFFITFFGCFFSLLFLVALAWKIKVRYSNFIVSRQRVQGMKLMARRPFAKVCLDVTRQEDAKIVPPSPIAVQPSENHAFAVRVFMMRLPGTEEGLVHIGQSGVCCATVLGTNTEARARIHSSKVSQRVSVTNSSFPKSYCL